LLNADLSDVDMSGANLTGATLTGATFCHTVMPDGMTNNSSCLPPETKPIEPPIVVSEPVKAVTEPVAAPVSPAPVQPKAKKKAKPKAH
jgi:hypothetical protein